MKIDLKIGGQELPQNSRLGGWINLKVGMSLSQAYSYILCKLQLQPIKTAEVAFFHLHFFHWRHIQWFVSLTYTNSTFFLLKNKKRLKTKGVMGKKLRSIIYFGTDFKKEQEADAGFDIGIDIDITKD